MIPKAIYNGSDNRHNLDQIERLGLPHDLKSAIDEQAKGVACLINKSKLKKAEGGWVFIDSIPTLSEKLEKKFKQKKIRKEEKFINEYVPGFGTAFLIGRRLALSAAHCICKENSNIMDDDAIQSTRLVFGFQNANEDLSDYLFADNQVHRIKKVISYQFTRIQNKFGNYTDWADWALLELEKDPPFTPLSMNMTKKVAKKIDLYMLGHPSGLPLKFTHKATVQIDNHADFFESDLDGFEGNSGSPVFEQDEKMVVGILCFGNKDYKVIDDVIHSRCVTRSEIGQKGYEVCQRISNLRFLYDNQLLGIKNTQNQENVSLSIIQALKSRYEAIVSKNNTIDLLFLDGKQRLLILGEVGSGKSFLCQQIASKWNQNALFSDKYKAVFWIPLYKLKTSHPLETTASFIFRICCQEHSADLYPDDLRKYLALNIDHVLFVLDGIDEVTANPAQKEILDEILTYPNWIATSRSTKAYDIKPDDTVKIEDLNPSMIKQHPFFDKIRQNPRLLNLCHNPLHLETITSFIKSSKNMCMVQSMTSLCEELCFQLQKHFLVKKGLSIARDWEKEHFQGKEILKPKSEKEFDEIHFIVNLFEHLETAAWKELQKVDLIIEIGFIQLQGNQKYSFVNPIFQQFFSARYLIRLFKKEQAEAIKIVKKMKSDFQYDMVLGFMVDLLKDDKENSKIFLKTLNDPQEGLGLHSFHLQNRFLKLCGWKGDPDNPFAPIQSALDQQGYSSAIDHLLFLFATDADPKLCYKYLFKLLPHFDNLDLLLKNLPDLIERSSDLKDFQYELNSKLSHWYIHKNHYQEALIWSAKALQISPSAHELTSQLFFKIIEKHLQIFLNSVDLQEYLIRIESLIPFCVTEEDRNSLYTPAKNKLLSHSSPMMNERQMIQNALRIPFERPQFLITEKYLNIFQKDPNYALQTFLEDVFLILGPPPCLYDIRKAKPLDKTACEFVLLVQNEDTYFTSLIEILKIQLSVVGKNGQIQLVTSASTLDSYELKTISLMTNPPSLLQECKKSLIRPPEMNIDGGSLLEFLTDLALFYNIKYTNVFNLIDALEIFTHDSRTLLKESVVSLENEKYHFLVMDPLTYFHPSHPLIDLVQIAFENSFPNPSSTLIHQIATHLCQTNAPLETHLLYFETLSKLTQDRDRQIYLECVKNRPEIFQALLEIPNQAGLCLSFQHDLKKLELALETMTDEFPEGVTTVAITNPNSSLPRYLKASLIESFLENTDIRKNYPGSAHNVSRLVYQGNDLHFKQKPSHPLMEYAIHNLNSRIAGKITPPSLLVRFDVKTPHGKKSYPVLVSQTIPGDNLKNAWHKVKANPNYTWTLLCAILTRPGDGRLANYILDEQDNLHCIDNDISFVEPVVKEMLLLRTVNFCCAPFCLLPLNTPLDPTVLQQFCLLDSHAILDSWIDDVIQKEKEYTELFTEEERKIRYQEDPEKSFTPTILLREGALATLYQQFWQLQNTISLHLQQEKTITAGDLLQWMISLREENIGAYIYKSYNNTQTTPEKKLQKATSKNQEQSMTSTQNHQACLGKIPTLQEIEKTRLFSPENAKKEFLFKFLQRNFDYAFFKSTAKGTSLQANFQDLINDPSRQSLVLQALIEQAKILKPTSLVIHHCNALNTKHLQSLTHLELTHLDLRYCSSIDDDAIPFISSCLQLKELLLSGTSIAAFQGGVFSRVLEFPQLKTLKLDRCLKLQTIQIRAPNLQVFTAKHNPKLHVLELKTMPIIQVDCSNSPQAQVIRLPMECVKILKGHTNSISSLIQLADGTLASGSWDKTIKQWNPKTGACIQTLQGHTDWVIALVQLADGTLASGSYDKTIKLWNPITGTCKQTLQGHKFGVQALIQLADGTLASGSNDKTIKLWNPKTGACIQTLQGHTDWVIALVQLADGTLASGSYDKTIKLWNPITGACKLTLKGHFDWVMHLIQLTDGTLACESNGKTIKLWDPIIGTCQQTLQGHASPVDNFILLADGTSARGSSDGTIKLWQ